MKKYLYAVLILCAAILVSSCSMSSGGGSDSGGSDGTGSGDGSTGSSYTITVNSATGGTITASPTASAVSGSTVTLSIAPLTGMALSSLTVTGANGSSVTTTPNDNCTSYTFTMPASDVTVSGTFAQGYNITVLDNVAGTHTTANMSLAAAGTTVTVYVLILQGYHAEQKALQVQGSNGTTIMATETSAQNEVNNLVYTFTMPAQDVTVHFNGQAVVDNDY